MVGESGDAQLECFIIESDLLTHMNKIRLIFLYFLVLCLFYVSAGCTSEAPEPVLNTPTVSAIPSTQSYVHEETLYRTPTEIPLHPITTQITQPPENIVCLIDHKEQVFTNSNKNAISFNLVNPPMYFNYTVIDTKPGSDGKYASYYSITILDKKTGVIYKQLGLGKDKQTGGYSNFGFGGPDIVKIMNTGNLQIETEGKDITLITDIWVKPTGNLGSSFDVKSTKCINWPETYQTGALHSSLGVNIAVESDTVT